MPPGHIRSRTPTDDAVPPSQKSQTLRRSNCNTIPHCRFKIEGEVRMVAPQDNAKSRSITEE